MKVRIASPMRSYTGGAANVTAAGETVADVLADLDRQFPGLRFRIVDEQGRLREHVNLWLDSERVRELAVPVAGADELVVMQALSGG
jgi:molybdopterin converting factor small subunit